ncbi:MAG: glycosyltransferase family 4 protein [Bacteroidetes bacterium]|nr:glycosyltransferase family 4 protein [Bacteroidota bacterium]
MKEKLVYIVSDIDKSLAFEWTIPHLKTQFDLSFILIGKENTALSEFLSENSVSYIQISDRSYPSRFSAWIKVFLILRKAKPRVVHTHLWRANLLGLTASWLLRIPKRIFTRHHATIHYDTYKSGLKWDRLCNFLATHIIAVSENVKKILVEYDKANSLKVKIIHHGFDLQYFESVEDARIATVRKKYGIDSSSSPVIGVIARYVEWKGIQYIIPAFAKLQKDFPQAHLILANAQGDYDHNIKGLLNTLPTGSFTEILFETDLAALYKIFDTYVHVPINATAEAFGQTYVEALASGVPSVFTLSGIARDFITDGYNAKVVDFQNTDQIYLALSKILTHLSEKNKLIANGRKSVNERFPIKLMLEKLCNLYES